MKRAVLMFGLSFAVLAGCSEKSGDSTEIPTGDVDPRQSVVDADRLEGIVADGVDFVTITISARDSTGAVTKNRLVEVVSSIDSDEITLDAPVTDDRGGAVARLTAVKAGRRMVTVKVDGIRLNATGQALAIEFEPGAASALAFLASPGAAQVGVPITPAVKVEILDANGNRTRGGDEVTLAVEGTDVSQVVAAVDGVATFQSFRLQSPGEHRLVATAPGLTSATSDAFDVDPGAPAHLTFEQEPQGSVAAGQPIPLKVAVRDSSGNVVASGPGSNAVVMVRLYSNPTRAQLEGTLSAMAVEGIATFDDVRLSKNASGYSLVAFTPDAPFQSAESHPFEVRPAVPAVASSSFSLAPAVGVADGRSPVRITIRLADAFGNAVPNQAVQLSSTGSGNTFTPSSNLFTNAGGRIEAELTSDVAEDKVVTANVVGQFSMGGVVHFAAGDIDAGQTTLDTEKTTAVANGADSITFELTVRDSAGNPIEAQRVVASASGSSNVWLAPGASGDTDEDGRISFTLTSTKAEQKTVSVSVAGLVYTSVVTYTAGAPSNTRSSKIAGDNQVVRVGHETQPLVVRILDENLNPIVGAPVTFTRSQGNGSFVEDDPLAIVKTVDTVADGTARTTYFMGTASGSGTDRVAATYMGVALEFVMNATPDVPASISVWPDTDPTTEAVVFTSLTGLNRVGVKVTDQYGNPIPNLVISFSIESEPGTPGATGALTSLTAQTTASGTNPPPGVALPLQQRLSQTPGPNVFKAKCTNAPLCGTIADDEVTFTITGLVGPPSKISVVNGSGQTGQVDSVLGDPLVARVTDQYDNPIGGQAVTFAPLDGGSVATGATGTTDPVTGTVQATYKLGTTVGNPNKDVASANCAACATTKVVNFTATAQAAAPDTLEEVSGGGQTGAVATPLAQPFRVRLRDTFGNPVSGRQVTFAVTSGGGNFAGQASTDATTNAAGEATAVLTLGDVAGVDNNTATATFAGLTPVTFTASSTPGAIATLAAVPPTPTSGTVGEPLAEDFVVEAKDAQGNLVVSRPNAVTFAVAGGHGASINPAGAVATDAAGRAATRLTLGTLAGTDLYTVTASAGSATPVVFAASAAASSAASLGPVSGSNQAGPINNPLPAPIVVEVLDANANPVSGVTVEFNVTSGGGSADPASIATGADGRASTSWILGPVPGLAHIMQVSVSGLPSLVFTAEGLDAGAVALGPAPNGDNQSGVVDTELPVPLKVLVTTAGGDPMPSQTVTFTAADGSFSDDTPSTDANGIASTLYTLGTTIGPKTVTATVGTKSVTFNLTAIAGAPDELELTWDDTTSGTVLQLLPTPVVAKVTDAFGNPVSGVTVTFTTTDEDAVVGTPSATTNAAGEAQSTWTLGKVAGPQSLTVTADGMTQTAAATAVADTPTKLELTWDDTTTGTVAQLLPAEIVATVTDDHDNPVSGVTVTFTTTDEDAEVGTPSTTTDAAGVARSTWTLGTVAGPQSVSVTAIGITRVAAATATADVPDSIAIAAGDGQVAIVGEEFGAAVAVIVRDEYGNPVEGATVNFSVDGGDAMATLGSDQVDTNANGLAWTTVTAGLIDDFIEVEASLDATKQVTFTLLSQVFGAGVCLGHGPSFRSLNAQVRVDEAGVFEASSAAGDHLLQIRVADAIDGVPEAGQVTTGVLLVCEDAGGSEYVQIDALGARLNGGEPDLVDIDTPLISATYDVWGWNLECASGGIVAVVADAFGEMLPLVQVTTGTATDGICLWDAGDPAPEAVAGPTLFVP